MKKVLSLLLIALLIISMTPVNVFATGNGNGGGNGNNQNSSDPVILPATISITDVTDTTALIALNHPKLNATYSVKLNGVDSTLGSITGLTENTSYQVSVTETYPSVEKKHFKVFKRENSGNGGNGDYYYINLENQEVSVHISETTGSNDNMYTKITYDSPITVTNTFNGSFTTLKTLRTISLTVQPGGIAFVNGISYLPGAHTLTGYNGDALSLRSLSNASFIANGFTFNEVTSTSGNTTSYIINGAGSITVNFVLKDDVFGKPFYVTDGNFSGFYGNGSDISGHNPMDDVLSASMTAVTDKASYKLGETAVVSLPVTVTDGDGSSSTLNEVEYYQNGTAKITAGEAPTNPVASYSYEIPKTLSALLADGFKNIAGTTQFEREFNYTLVDIYHGSAAAAVLATAKAKIIVNFEPTIYMTVDNKYTLYHNGVALTPDFTPAPTTYPWQSVKWYSVPLKTGDVLAVEGIDEGVVAGFLGQIHFDGNVFSTATESFWRQSTVLESGWELPSFDMTKSTNWKKVSEFTYGSWTGLIGLPSGSTAKWVWSSNNNYSNGGDKKVYFRYVVGGQDIDYVNLAPVITLKGEAVMSVVEGSSFTDPGTTVTDDHDKNLVAVATGTVDTSKTGDYTITYNVTDNGGLSAVPVTRTVQVIAKPLENQKPTIKLEGSASITLEEGSTFIDPGATANDPEDGALEIIKTGEVITSVPGTYTLTYKATDKNGASTDTLTRTVIVTEKPAPTNPETETGTENNNGNNGNNSPATTEPNEVDIVTEANALGSAAGNTEATTEVESTEAEIQPVVSVEETTEAEEIELFDEQNALGDALPKTGQLPAELFYGIGGLLSAAGVFLRKGKK